MSTINETAALIAYAPQFAPEASAADAASLRLDVDDSRFPPGWWILPFLTIGVLFWGSVAWTFLF